MQERAERARGAACARLDVAARIEAVHLVEQLQHGALDLALAPALALVPLRADRIHLICSAAVTQQWVSIPWNSLMCFHAVPPRW